MVTLPPRRWKNPVVLIALSVLTLGGLAVGSTALAATSSTHPSPHQNSALVAAAQPQPAHVFARNAHGLTYGSELDASDPAHAPDLIAAYATNGKLGYVLKRELHPQGPNGPAAALRAQAAAKTATQIPVYAVDGRTQIGVYEITPPHGG